MKIQWALVVVLAAMVGCSSMHKSEENEGKEEKMKLGEVPAAVRETLMHEANGATIDKVDKEEGKDGKIVYETDVMMDGKNWEIRVDPDGHVISKKVEADGDEKSGKKESGGKEEDEKDEKGEKEGK